MTDLFGKVSIYDMLSMLIPGYLVCFLIVKVTGIDCDLQLNDVTLCIVAFCASYVAGLIIHYISRRCFRWLNHSDRLSRTAYEQFQNDYERRQQLRVQGHAPTSQETYYEIFFRLWGENSIAHIPPLESQLSFVRSMAIVGLLYSILGCRFMDCTCVSLAVIFTLLCVFLSVSLRKRIYYYYYEAQRYMQIRRND